MIAFRTLAAATLLAAPLIAGQALAADPAPTAPRTERRVIIIEEKAPAGAADSAAQPGAVRHERRVVVGGADGAMPALPEERGCKDGQPPVEAQGSDDANGQHHVVRMRICGSGDKAAALDGIKRARARVAEDTQISATAKQQVLQQLDAEIERLSKQG